MGSEMGLGIPAAGRGSWRPMRIGDGKDWSFVGKPWKDRDAGAISPTPTWFTGAEAYDGQRGLNDDTLSAFHIGTAYGDFEAEVKFRWDAGHCGAGIIFGARDARQYYLAHFPNIAQ